jgi:hypothetical protein
MNAMVVANTASCISVTSSISGHALPIQSVGAVTLATGRRSAWWSSIRLGQKRRWPLESRDNYLDTHRVLYGKAQRYFVIRRSMLTLGPLDMVSATQ